MFSRTNGNQISVKWLVVKKLFTPSVFSIVLIFLFSLFSFKYWITWYGSNQFSYDVDQYYSYIIAGIVYEDFSFKIPHTFWLTETPIHTYVPKGTMGLSLLYLPWFAIADKIAFVFDYKTDGYSAPYAWCIHLGSILYVIIGLWYLRKTLLLFFNEWITAITVFFILFATNLFYYTYKETEMPHSYLFLLFSVFFYHVVKWYHTKQNKHLYYFSFFAGFATLIRPTEILILIVPLLYGIYTIKQLKERFRFVWSLKWKLLLAIVAFTIPLIPQLIFWKIYAGQFLFFSYGGKEGFFFSDPQIVNVLFGWRKGWFVYTPLMLLAMIGLFSMLFKWRGMFVPISVYLVLNIYIISCWWDWGFGGAFGMRALVQSYAFLAIPLAFLFKQLYSFVNVYTRRVSVFFVALCCSLFLTINIFQAWQVKNYYFHWDGMTKEAYFYTLFKVTYTPEDRVYLETLIKRPDYQELLRGNRDE